MELSCFGFGSDVSEPLQVPSSECVMYSVSRCHNYTYSEPKQKHR